MPRGRFHSGLRNQTSMETRWCQELKGRSEEQQARKRWTGAAAPPSRSLPISQPVGESTHLLHVTPRTTSTTSTTSTTITAPIVATTILPISPALPLMSSNENRSPPTKAPISPRTRSPTIPRSVPVHRPASHPATSPTMIRPMIPPGFSCTCPPLSSSIPAPRQRGPHGTRPPTLRQPNRLHPLHDAVEHLVDDRLLPDARPVPTDNS